MSAGSSHQVTHMRSEADEESSSSCYVITLDTLYNLARQPAGQLLIGGAF